MAILGIQIYLMEWYKTWSNRVDSKSNYSPDTKIELITVDTIFFLHRSEPEVISSWWSAFYGDMGTDINLRGEFRLH